MTTRVTISLDDETAAIVKALADKQIRSMSSMAAAMVVMQAREVVDSNAVSQEEVKAAKETL